MNQVKPCTWRWWMSNKYLVTAREVFLRKITLSCQSCICDQHTNPIFINLLMSFKCCLRAIIVENIYNFVTSCRAITKDARGLTMKHFTICMIMKKHSTTSFQYLKGFKSRQNVRQRLRKKKIWSITTWSSMKSKSRRKVMWRNKRWERQEKTRKVENLFVVARGGLATSHILLFTLTSKQNIMELLHRGLFVAKVENLKREVDPKLY